VTIFEALLASLSPTTYLKYPPHQRNSESLSMESPRSLTDSLLMYAPFLAQVLFILVHDSGSAYAKSPPRDRIYLELAKVIIFIFMFEVYFRLVAILFVYLAYKSIILSKYFFSSSFYCSFSFSSFSSSSSSSSSSSPSPPPPSLPPSLHLP